MENKKPGTFSNFSFLKKNRTQEIFKNYLPKIEPKIDKN